MSLPERRRRPDRGGGARRAYRGLRLGAGRLRRRLLRRRRADGRGRTVALLDQSVAFLKSLGLWAGLRAPAAPLRSCGSSTTRGALFPPRPIEFHASEIGLDAFGWNIENDRMAEALAAEIAEFPGVERIATGVAAYEFARRRGPGAARRRARDLGPARDRRRRPGFDGAARRRARSARSSLPADRADGASRPSAAA